jgi:Transcriptional regulator, AbiEi antitoxin
MTIDWEGDAGVFLRRHAIAQGCDDRELRRLVRSGALHRIRRGAYVAGDIWAQADPVGRHRLAARAVLLTAHPSAVLTHVSAVLEHDAPVWDVDLSEVHLTRTDGVSGRREAGVVHHCGGMPATDVALGHGLPVSTPGRAAIELTTLAGVEQCLVTVNWMLAERMTTKAELQGYVARFQHWPRSLRSDLTVRLVDGRNKWPIETRFSHLVWRQRLPPIEPQYEVFDESGRLVAVLDFAYPEYGVFIELDGRIKYERYRREGETLEEYIRREKRREERVCLLTGWVCIRLTWEDLARPAATARRIRAVLDSRPR